MQALVRARKLDFVVKKPTLLLSGNTVHLPEYKNPHNGPRAFQAADVADFFGPEWLTRKLLLRLAEKSSISVFWLLADIRQRQIKHRTGWTCARTLARDLEGSENWYIADTLQG